MDLKKIIYIIFLNKINIYKNYFCNQESNIVNKYVKLYIMFIIYFVLFSKCNIAFLFI